MENIDNRTIILQEALALITKKGYDAVGVSEICQNAGVTKPTLYHYFGSKKGVLEAVLNLYFDELNIIIGEHCIYHPEPDAYERDIYPVLYNLMARYFLFARENSSFYSLLLNSQAALNESLTVRLVNEKCAYQYAMLEQLFLSIAAVHSHMKGKERLFASLFLGTVNTCVALWFRQGTELDQTFTHMVVRQFMHGIHA